MRIKAYGTRGSISVAGPEFVRYGGNTTCLRVLSDCIPRDTAFVLDAGAGLRQCSKDIMGAGILNLAVAITHWHWDHTLGFVMAAHTHVPTARVKVFGPKEYGYGPEQNLGVLLRRPQFPVDFEAVEHRFKLVDLERVGNQVLLIHPQGGFHLIPRHVFDKHEEEKTQVPMGKVGRFPLSECLVVKMFRAKHPEYAVSYRLEERTTGRVFVFLTDHENTAAFPLDLKAHLKGANLLVQDCQYSQAFYEALAGGWGHGTPEYCAKTAIVADADVLALTHHDPNASDDDVDQRVAEAKAAVVRESGGGKIPVVLGLADFMELEV